MRLREPQLELNAFDPCVQDEHVKLLDAVGGFAGQNERVFALAGRGAAIFAEETDAGDRGGVGGVERVQDVRRTARGGEHDQHVAGSSESLHPAGKDLIEAVVVGGAGDVPRIDAGDRGKRAAISAETTGEFFGKVGRVAGRAAVAYDEDFASGAHA